MRKRANLWHTVHMAWNPTRLARNLSAAVVAGIAAWSSYHHMVEVALRVGERPDVAYVLPLSVDGMLVVASVAMVDDRRSGRRVRWSARLAFVAGVFASVGANVAAAEPTVGARIVAAWPAVALLLTVELLSRTGRLLTRHETTAASEASTEATPTVASPVDTTPDTEPISAPMYVVTDTGTTADPEPDDITDQVPGGPRYSTPEARALAIGYAMGPEDITHDEIGRRIGRHSRTVSRYLREAGIPRPSSGAPVNGHRVHELEAVAAGHSTDA